MPTPRHSNANTPTTDIQNLYEEQAPQRKTPRSGIASLISTPRTPYQAQPSVADAAMTEVAADGTTEIEIAADDAIDKTLLPGSAPQNTRTPLSEYQKMGATLFVALLTGVFYYKTTERATLVQRITGPGTNVLGAIFTVYASIAALDQRRVDGKALAAAGIATAAFLPTVPQVLITVIGSKDGPIFTAVAGAATLLSGTGLYAYAMVNLVEMIRALPNSTLAPAAFRLKRFLNLVSREENELFMQRENALKTLSQLIEGVRYADNLDALSHVDINDINDKKLIVAAKQIASPAALKARSTLETSVVDTTTFLLQAASAFVLTYGSIGYTCAVANDAEKTFKLGHIGGSVAGLMLMGFQYVLNIIGAVKMGHSLIDTAKNLVRYQKFPNEFNVGNMLVTSILKLAFLLGAGISYDSGFTAVRLLERECPTSGYHALRFPDDVKIVNWGTFGFNAIFATLAISSLAHYWVNHTGEKNDRFQTDRSFLNFMGRLEALKQKIERMDRNELSTKHQDLIVALTPTVEKEQPQVPVAETTRFFTSTSQDVTPAARREEFGYGT